MPWLLCLTRVSPECYSECPSELQPEWSGQRQLQCGCGVWPPSHLFLFLQLQLHSILVLSHCGSLPVPHSSGWSHCFLLCCVQICSFWFTWVTRGSMSRVPDQNGVFWLYNMLEIHHSYVLKPWCVLSCLCDCLSVEPVSWLSIYLSGLHGKDYCWT